MGIHDETSRMGLKDDGDESVIVDCLQAPMLSVRSPDIWTNALSVIVGWLHPARFSVRSPDRCTFNYYVVQKHSRIAAS